MERLTDNLYRMDAESFDDIIDTFVVENCVRRETENYTIFELENIRLFDTSATTPRESINFMGEQFPHATTIKSRLHLMFPKSSVDGEPFVIGFLENHMLREDTIYADYVLIEKPVGPLETE